MRSCTVDNELCVVTSPSDHYIKLKRSMALLVDLVLWYLLYVLMVFILSLFMNGIPTILENPMYYKEQIDSIITSKTFIIVYLGSLILYEIVIPILNNGQSISKRMFNMRISYEKDKTSPLALRGAIKILVLNPYGIIAYLCNQIIPLVSTNMYADIMLLILAVCIGVALFNPTGKSLHDMISHTYVIKD